MTNLITGIIGIAGVAIFLGIMIFWVPAPPVFIIVAVVIGLLLVDFVQSLRTRDNDNRH